MSKKILLVDDEKETSVVFETALKQGGFDVRVAQDGQTALSLVKAEMFDLILLDQMMPDISGVEVLKQIKADSKTSGIQVAMLTNFGHDEMIKEALSKGAVDYILKYQISPIDLIAKVKGLIGE